ncbi:FtsK/SpoIIIE domain-containing protein [uncultured Amnibacterium sp.]|uniref:FtsK/SpoIIIE domain-containing protein n=1 Tax=uncultured Amnibacterium sp. TaxID=1631851 RepID=UPI0035CB59E1
MTDPLTLPVRPAAADPPPFPLLAAVAPLLVAGALFAATRAPEVLLFAVFSPVLAVAGVVDGRLGARRRLRREQQRHRVALEALQRELAVRIATRATAVRRRQPSSAVLAVEPATWRARPPTGSVVIGTGDEPIEPLLRGTAADAIEAALITESALLPDVPVTVPADTTLAVVGPPQLTAPAARAISVQRARGGGRLELPAVAAGPDGQDADVVLALESCTTARIVHAVGPHAHLSGRVLTPCFVTAVAHEQVRAALSGAAPTTLADVMTVGEGGPGLAARFVVDGTDPVEVDLVRDGPHAVVGGTTGSGKSGLLTAWVLALATSHPASRLQLLLVDCKGGAAFDAVRDLPQVAGVVTDLDPAGALRAIAGLTAELVRRERALRAAAVPDVAATDLPRLVIVVDEFRTLLERAPQLADVFVDIGARGRSLGVHLLLCTQRPTGLGSELLANCGLRIALRMQDGADSVALIGTPAAASLPRNPGAALIAIPGERPRRVQVADVSDGAVAVAVARVRERAPAGPLPPRPWLDPLPAVLPLEQLLADHAAESGSPTGSSGDIVLGRLDLPAEQRQPVLTWNPVVHPRLLVLGESGSGRSTVLAVIAAQSGAVLLSRDPASAWDQVHDDHVPLLIDGLERLLDVLGPTTAAALLDRLIVRLRRPDAEPTVLALHGPSAWAGAPLRPLLGLVDRTLLLRLGGDDHLAITGDRRTAGETLPPGGGWWSGARVQVALPTTSPAETRAVVAAPLEACDVLVVSAAPRRRAEQLRLAGFRVIGAGELDPLAAPIGAPRGTPADPDDRPSAIVGGVDDWQARWSALTRLRATGTLLTDGLSPAEFRVVTGRAQVPPPVSHPADVLLVPQEGPVVRRRLQGCGHDRPIDDARGGLL